MTVYALLKKLMIDRVHKKRNDFSNIDPFNVKILNSLQTSLPDLEKKTYETLYSSYRKSSLSTNVSIVPDDDIRQLRRHEVLKIVEFFFSDGLINKGRLILLIALVGVISDKSNDYHDYIDDFIMVLQRLDFHTLFLPDWYIFWTKFIENETL